MKKDVLKTGLFSLILLVMFSCAGTDKEADLADERISELERYVDSLKSVSAEERQENWNEISTNYEAKVAQANEAISNLNEKDRVATQEKINASTAKYDKIKVTILTEDQPIDESNADMNKTRSAKSSQQLRDKLFGAGKLGADMNFNWVNKDNILSVYDRFYEAYKDNKSNFSREDYDEAKLMYEALDTRKNTVEKEGLSSEDNMKIASIKFKLAPMFKVNRIGAKSKENQEAKE
ncbi:hypothetical protein [Flavobacterium sp.]|uniref:hypothetical protein n=1 Tax=Flavobacterium sp. TaxID=239 RepID=UPI002FDEA427